MKCKGCNRDLLQVEFQSRSADEAHTVAYKCIYCPLHIDKFDAPRSQPHIYLKRIERKFSRTPHFDVGNTRRGRILHVTSRKSLDIRDLAEVHASNVLDSSSKLFKSYSDGPWANMSISSISKKSISLNAFIEEIEISDRVYRSSNAYVDFKYMKLMDDYIIIPDSGRTRALYLIYSDSNDEVIDSLRYLYSVGFCPDNLYSYVDSIFLGSISNLNSRAYDASSAEDNKHYFSSKPDGERVLLVNCGTVWLYCRRLLGFKIISFHMDSHLKYMHPKKLSPVLDIELMIGFKPILIDVLVDGDGNLSPYDRNVDWILDSMKHLQDSNSYLNEIYVRPFFHTFEDAYNYTKDCKYPTDGIVAISMHGTDMKKLKTIRSMELYLHSDYILKSKNDTSLMKVSEDTHFEIGSVIEIRFTVSEGKMNIIDSFQRFDKVSPNDDDAILSILSSSTKSNEDTMLRNTLWRWSNKLRFNMYHRANQMRPDRNIVLDIGSGSGQSSDAFSKLPGCSFILVEPDKDKCTRLMRRLNIRSFESDVRSIIQSIPSLKKGSRKYHILNCSMKDLLDDKPTRNALSHSIKCAIACFSAQYIMDDISSIIQLGIPFIGCYYSYEGIGIGESIVNNSGIEMTRISETEASVKWGNDKPYIEPAIEDDDIAIGINQIEATHMAQITSSSDIVHRVCSHVRVLMNL